MPEIREISEKYTSLASELIDTIPGLEHIKEARPMITFLESEYEKKSQGKVILGLTEKVPSKNKWALQSDFTITIYTENLKKYNFDEEQERILMYHELLHVGIDDGRYYVKPHDLEDFREIINQYGAYWDEKNLPKMEAK
ncbi:putative metallopeptidase [Pseudobutyrivibrio sp.]